jgi:hypothetical protein
MHMYKEPMMLTFVTVLRGGHVGPATLQSNIAMGCASWFLSEARPCISRMLLLVCSL